MQALIQQISETLKADCSDPIRTYWRDYIIDNQIAVTDLLPLIHAEYTVASRFSWVLGGICDKSPSVVYPAVTYFFSKRKEIKIPNFRRSIAKMFYLAGVPEEIEGEAIDAMFRWMLDPNANVSTKTMSVLALYKLYAKYPELGPELRSVIEDQLDKNSVSFCQKAKPMLESLPAY